MTKRKTKRKQNNEEESLIETFNINKIENFSKTQIVNFQNVMSIFNILLPFFVDISLSFR